MTAPHSPTVAIVMPAHRSGPDLAASVSSIEALDPAPDEYVVVVDGGDPAVMEQIGSSRTVIAIARSGPAAARNVGVRATTSEVALFIDSDIVVPPDLISRVRRAMQGSGDPGTAPDAIIGAYDDAPAVGTTVSEFRNLLHHWTHHQAAGPGHTFWAGCGAVRREAFEVVDGFDERYRDATIEDIDLGERLFAAGFAIEVVPTIEVKHLKKWSLVSMVHTDIVKRGVPWSRLMLRDGAMSDDLNTTRAARLTVALVGLFAASALTTATASGIRRGSVAVTMLLGMTLVWRDRGFLGYLRGKRSLRFATAAVPLMWIHHLSAGIAFAWAVATWPVAKRRTR